jgi:hypothetical protein
MGPSIAAEYAPEPNIKTVTARNRTGSIALFFRRYLRISTTPEIWLFKDV